MRALKLLVVGIVAAAALAIAVPALGANAPFPMNPYPAQEVGYTFNLQTLFGHGSKTKPTTSYCADSSVFKRGHQIVFRLYIVNTKTGKVLTGKNIRRVVLRIAGQPDFTMPFRPQGGNPDATAPWLWSYAWIVPGDYPLGTFKFNIAAQIKQTGNTAKWVVYNPVVPGTDWQITP